MIWHWARTGSAHDRFVYYPRGQAANGHWFADSPPGSYHSHRMRSRSAGGSGAQVGRGEGL